MTGLLWEPFQIGNMRLKNRLVMAPMATQYGSELGYVTDRIKNYYEARARGGVGLIIVEFTYVHPRGQLWPNQMGISDDKFIPGMSELAQAIHKHGAKAALQLHHGGRTAKSTLNHMQPIAPSPLGLEGGETPKELSKKEITEVITHFAQAAKRAKKAGFDGVEIHGAHGYLIDQFLSRSSNKRRDEYGGSIVNRARLLIEIITSIREQVGEDYPVWCRINGKEYGTDEGTTLEEARETARMAQRASCDAIHVTAWGAGSPTIVTSPRATTAVIEDLIYGIKKVVSVPVIGVGRISPEAGERMIAEGKVDLVAIGKRLLADPELPNKFASGRSADVNPCIVCMSCRDDIYDDTVSGIRCSVNACLGKENEFRLSPTDKPKKVLVIGGGPSGMEAARVAALREHNVTLWEKDRRLGGQLIQAAIPPHKDRIKALTTYLQRQLEGLGVTIELAKEATAQEVVQFCPDALILATGVKMLQPKIPGLENANVVSALDILDGKVEAGRNVVVIGGELVACETAEFLAEKAKHVTVTRRGPEMALLIRHSLREFFLDRLSEKGVALLTGVKYNKVTTDGLEVMTKEGERQTVPADTIVIATGSTPNRGLYEQLKERIPQTFIIGDCVVPRTIRDAIADGFRVGLEI